MVSGGENFLSEALTEAERVAATHLHVLRHIDFVNAQGATWTFIRYGKIMLQCHCANASARKQLSRSGLDMLHSQA